MADDYRDTLFGPGVLGLVDPGQSASGTIEISGDRDVFATTLISGLTYELQNDGFWGLPNPYLQVLDDNGVTLDSNDNYGGILDSLISFTPASTGTYYLLASDSSYNTGGYTVWVSEGFGSDGDDTIAGTDQRDAINSADGNDRISGLGGDDDLSGGSGDDLLHGGDGNDWLKAGAGSDTLYGDEGNDWLTLVERGSAYGGDGNDSLIGGSERSYVYGGTGDDTYFMSDWDGDNGSEFWPGYNSSQARIVEYAGEGTDTVDLSGYQSFILPQNVENAVADFTCSSITLIGNELANHLTMSDDGGYFTTQAPGSLYGMGGNDTLSGGLGEQVLDGGSGADLLEGGYDNDTYYVDNVQDRVIEVVNEVFDDDHFDQYRDPAPGGIDNVFSSVTYTLPTLVENLTLTGSATNGTGNSLANALTGNGIANSLSGLAGNDTLAGGTGNDTLSGGDGADSLNGNAGADSLAGGTGNDTYYVDNIADKVTETTAGASGGTDIVYSSVSFTLGTNVESLRMIPGSGNVNGTGNASDNELWGTSGVNTLRGLGGADSFDSGSGADVIVGGTGNDVFKFSSTVGSDQTARDRIVAGDGAVAFEKPGASLGDRFDFSKMDANTGVAGQQHFVFGTSTGVGHIWAVTSGTDTLIRGNVDGDAAVEFEVAIADGSVSHTVYSAADFIL